MTIAVMRKAAAAAATATAIELWHVEFLDEDYCRGGCGVSTDV